MFFFFFKKKELNIFFTMFFMLGDLTIILKYGWMDKFV